MGIKTFFFGIYQLTWTTKWDKAKQKKVDSVFETKGVPFWPELKCEFDVDILIEIDEQLKIAFKISEAKNILIHNREIALPLLHCPN